METYVSLEPTFRFLFSPLSLQHDHFARFKQVDVAKTYQNQARKFLERARAEQHKVLEAESAVLEELETEPEDLDGDGLIDIDSD